MRMHGKKTLLGRSELVHIAEPVTTGAGYLNYDNLLQEYIKRNLETWAYGSDSRHCVDLFFGPDLAHYKA